MALARPAAARWQVLGVGNGNPGAAVLSPDLQSVRMLPEVPFAWGGDVTRDGHWFAVVGTTTHEVQVWEFCDPPRLSFRQSVPSAWYTRTVAIADDGGTVVVGGGGRGRPVLDVRTNARRLWPAHAGPIQDVDLADDGRIVTAGADRTAAVWSADGLLLTQLRGHRLGLWSARFFADGRHVVTSSGDGTALVWPLEEADVLALAHRDLHPENRRQELQARADLIGDLLDTR